jgi:hypothetical protein
MTRAKNRLCEEAQPTTRAKNRHCEEAKPTKQSPDCFAPLAMT